MNREIKVNKIKFICIGAQKAGTTWFWENIKKHPQVDFPPAKEISYFSLLHYYDFYEFREKKLNRLKELLNNFHLEKDEKQNVTNINNIWWWIKFHLIKREDVNDQWYLSLFDNIPNSMITGDVSPDYSFLPIKGIEHMHNLLPNIKIIFILRDPVYRAISGSIYSLRKGKKKITDSLIINRMSAERQKALSNYPSIIKKYESIFSSEKILYLFYDDIVTGGIEVLKKTCDFLNIDFDKDFFPDVKRKRNQGPSVSYSTRVISHACKEYYSDLLWLEKKFNTHYAQNWLAEATKFV